MPRAVTGNAYIPAPVGAESFDVEAEDLKRQRARVEALLSSKQAEGLPGWKGAAAQTILAIARGYNDKTLGDKEADLAKRKSAAAQAWLEKRPGDTPGQAEINPSVPPAALEMYGGGPPMPTNYQTPPPQGPTEGLAPIPNAVGEPQPEDFQKMPGQLGGPPPVPQPLGGMLPQTRPTYEHTPELPMLPASIADTSKWAAEGAGYSPMHAQFAAHALKQSIDAPEKAAQAKLAREAKSDEAQKGRVQRLHELNLKMIEANTQKEKEGIRRLQELEYRGADALQRIELTGIIKEGLKNMAAAGSAAAKTPNVVREGTALNGDTVYRDTKDPDAKKFTTDANGVRVPYNGKVISAGENKSVEKAIDSASALKNSIDLAERAAKPENKAAFEFAANVGGTASAKTGGYISEEVLGELTDEQSMIRSEVGRDFAELMHRLYGSAYTTGEQATAAKFAVLPGMDQRTIVRRLRQQADFHKKMESQYGDKIRAAAKARSGGDQRKPLSEL